MEILSNTTMSLVGKALDVAFETHKAISNNISNVNSTDYQRMHVDFDAVMSEVIKAYDGDQSDSVINGALSRVRPFASIDASSSEVFLDKEIVALVENTLNYQALINARGKLGEITKLAISGGK